MFVSRAAISACSYLRERQHGTGAPRRRQHGLVSPPGRDDRQRVEDGELPVQADHHGNKGTGVHGLELEEHEEPAGQVAGHPLDRDVPHGIHGHHDEGHQKVGYGQVDDQHAHVGPALLPAGGPQHRQVAEGGEATEDEGDEDSHFGRCGEGGQLQRRRQVPGRIQVSVRAALRREEGSPAVGGLVHFVSLSVLSISLLLTNMSLQLETAANCPHSSA